MLILAVKQGYCDDVNLGNVLNITTILIWQCLKIQFYNFKYLEPLWKFRALKTLHDHKNKYKSKQTHQSIPYCIP